MHNPVLFSMIDRIKTWKKRIIVISIPLIIFPGTLSAHALGQKLGDFYGGFLHPLLVLGHILPLMALSILAGQQGPETGRKSFFIFLGALLAGILIATLLPTVNVLLMVNTFSMVFTGILVAMALTYPKWLIFLLVIIFGITHGYENGLELITSDSPLLFTIGILCGGMLLFAWFSSLTISFKKSWFQIALRVLGSWVAAIGILIIGLTF